MFLSFTVCSLICLLVASGQDVTDEVQWKSLPLGEYNGFNTANLLSFDVPTSTKAQTLTLQSLDESNVCPVREVQVHFQYGSFPVINPYNESFPENFYLERSEAQNVTLHTDNKSQPVSVQSPKSGSWFLTAFLLKTDKKIRPKGFTETCNYMLNLKIVSTVLIDVQEVNIEKDAQISIPVTEGFKILRYIPPEGTYFYKVSIDKCLVQQYDYTDQNVKNSSCPVIIDIAMDEIPSQQSEDSYSYDCFNSSLPCEMVVKKPYVSRWNYIRISVDNDALNSTSVQLNLRFEIEKCKVSKANSTTGNQVSPSHNETCEVILGLGRLGFFKEDFTGTFIFPNSKNQPDPKVAILVPDATVLLTYFIINAQTDSGGTLKLRLEIIKGALESTQDGKVWFCLMKYRIASLETVINCDGGIGLTASTLSNDTSENLLYVPYPEEGKWYIGLHSTCFNKSNSGIIEGCKHKPTIKMQVVLSKCVDNKCGQHGICKEYISGLLLYSACECFEGWRGYGCTDGTRAVSESTALAAVLMLTLSNLFFIPGIILALRRRYFVEAFVYLYNMFFSTFYHACDTNKHIHRYCMMPYAVLSYCDLYGSITSFWVTILAMASISDRLRSFLHALGALGIALAVEFNQHYSHGIWSFVIPTLISVTILIISWVHQCRLRKTCFPSKKHYVQSLLPGVVLSGAGLLIFTFLETDDNYKYTHSVWHIVISLSIVFLLPKHRRSTDEKLQNSYGVEESVRMIQNAASHSDDEYDDDDDEPLLINHSSRNLVL